MLGEKVIEDQHQVVVDCKGTLLYCTSFDDAMCRVELEKLCFFHAKSGDEKLM